MEMSSRSIVNKFNVNEVVACLLVLFSIFINKRVPLQNSNTTC
jgi:hypothetical protein